MISINYKYKYVYNGSHGSVEDGPRPAKDTHKLAIYASSRGIKCDFHRVERRDVSFTIDHDSPAHRTRNELVLHGFTKHKLCTLCMEVL